MLSRNSVAARVVAILASRRINEKIHHAPGCEDLALRDRRLLAALAGAGVEAGMLSGPEQCYHSVLQAMEKDPRLEKQLLATVEDPFPSSVGKLVSFVLSCWSRLPQEQRILFEPGELWIEKEAAGWTAIPAEVLDQFRYIARQTFLFSNLWLLRRLARLLDETRLNQVRDFPAVPFSAVLDDEMEEIEKRRGVPSSAARAGTPDQRADQAGLVGLAFSGGGIRSATFNLGVLQFLGQKGLLRHFDYLSTVSGGGYIGSWLHGWIHRTGKGGMGEVQRSLSPEGISAEPIRFLRRYSNYLTPQTGFLSADTWTMLHIWLRNLALNLVVIILALSALLLVPRWLAALLEVLDDFDQTDHWVLLMIPAACLVGLNLRMFHRVRTEHGVRAWLARERTILILIVAPIFLAALGAGTTLSRDSLAGTQYVLGASLLFGLEFAVAVLLISVLARLDKSFYPEDRPKPAFLPGIWAYVGIAWVTLVAFIGITLIHFYSFAGFSQWTTHRTAWELTTWGAPVFVAVITLSGFLSLGLLGKRFPDDRREWMARLGAWLSISCIAWIGFCGAGLYGPLIVAKAASWIEGYFEGAGLSAATVVTVVAGLLSGRANTMRATNDKGNRVLDLATKAAPPVFAIGLVLLLSYWLHAGITGVTEPNKVVSTYGQNVQIRKPEPPSPEQERKWEEQGDKWGTWEYYWSGYRAQPALREGWDAFLWSIFCGILACLLSRRIDINEFSLHQFYRNRLVRCYLGASRAAERKPNRFTGFDADDDIRLAALAPSAGYSGPFPIFNTTVNVIHGEELAWQDRKGESFVFTPKYCGFDVENKTAPRAGTGEFYRLSAGGYRPTLDYAYPNYNKDNSNNPTDSGIKVGTVMAISGAAASPNMGSYTSPATAFLMTVLDLRLGWWLGNPRRIDTWQRSSPRTAILYLLAELAAQTSDQGQYVYLSDGGHFENFGVYELVRRRCRYIVVCDAEQDGDYVFGGLGNAIRKCLTDFGVEIRILTNDIRPEPGAKTSRSHCALGAIHYPDGPPGALIYLKSSLTGDEPADVQQYALEVPAFPHESTADQWFNEAQFESYRKLGYHVAQCSFEFAGDSAGPSGNGDDFLAKIYDSLPKQKRAAAAGSNVESL